MVDRTLFDKTIQALGIAMNFRALNHDIISSNVANVDTPGYQAKKLDFESHLKTALDMDGKDNLKTSNSRHFTSSAGGLRDVRGNIFFDPRIAIRNDLNSVDLDEQMANLAENQLLQNAETQIISKKLALLKYAVNEGGL
jgi:flagellar basal-body rod protein FlgB